MEVFVNGMILNQVTVFCGSDRDFNLFFSPDNLLVNTEKNNTITTAKETVRLPVYLCIFALFFFFNLIFFWYVFLFVCFKRLLGRLVISLLWEEKWITGSR